jgi:hypothetical protein
MTVTRPGLASERPITWAPYPGAARTYAENPEAFRPNLRWVHHHQPRPRHPRLGSAGSRIIDHESDERKNTA